MVVPGKPDQSLLIDLVRSGKMPRSEKKVSEKDLGVLQRPPDLFWISSVDELLGVEPLAQPLDVPAGPGDRGQGALDSRHPLPFIEPVSPSYAWTMVRFEYRLTDHGWIVRLRRERRVRST